MFNFIFKKQKNIKSYNKGFTLIELIVAIGIFAIVIVIALGAILVIIDSNKKSQTLSSVVTNLNFAVDSITRDVKVGQASTLKNVGNNLQEFNIISEGRNISFRINDNKLQKKIELVGTWQDITAEEITIEQGRLEVIGGGANSQPRLLIILKGKATVLGGISSDFHIQSTISPRQLNL